MDPTTVLSRYIFLDYYYLYLVLITIDVFLVVAFPYVARGAYPIQHPGLLACCGRCRSRHFFPTLFAL